MAAFSQNGYPANDRSFITTYEVTKTGRRLALRSGPAGQLLAHWVRWFDENIRDIDPGILDDWGYAERAIRGGVELSNHASGTAADVDATRWPLGVQPEAYLTAAEIAKVRARLKAYEGCIRWGGDYTGRKDPMHFEINRPEADCARVLKNLLADQQEEDMSAQDVKQINDWVNFRINQLAGFVRGEIRTEVVARIAGQNELIRQLAADDDLDLDAITAAVDKAVAKAVNPTELAQALVDAGLEGASVDELAKAVADELHRRTAD